MSLIRRGSGIRVTLNILYCMLTSYMMNASGLTALDSCEIITSKYIHIVYALLLLLLDNIYQY